MWEVKHQAMLETYDACCRNCNKKYWECCAGITMLFERVQGCNRALEKYAERYGKLTDRKNRY